MMSSLNGRISLQGFCLGLTLFCLIIFLWLLNEYIFSEYTYLVSLIHFIICVVAILVRFTAQALQVALRAFCLGYGFSIGLLIILFANESWSVFGWYLCLLTIFHYSEYYIMSVINPKSLSLDSYLINHSREYCVAAVCSWLEFFIERYSFPGMKILWLSWIGLGLCIAGEIIRKLAMFTARSNFNHIIQIQREEGHVLVTHGIYRWFRHPSYVGWFWWSIGTQIVLCNPLCIIGYTFASWNFFDVRIQEEEITLLNFFGEDYVQYQKRVGTGLPFIKGYRIEL